MQLLKEAIPKLSSIAVLWDPATGPVQLKGVEIAAEELKVKVEIMDVPGNSNLDDSIFAASSKGVDAILMLSSAVIGANAEYLAGLTLGLRLPAVTIFPDFARRGGLMAYGINPLSLFRQSAPIVAKVLRGSKPSEVPAELPTKFELVVNLKTAKRLGIVFPTSILLQADEVIE
jgi:putative tryptophan/tyrosine transport system substrate-binding protein